MLYSVFNPDSVQYDYFQGVGPRFGERVTPRARGSAAAGTPPEAVMPLLPEAAVRVGHGPEARGVLAVSKTDALGQVPAGTFVQKHPWLSVGIAIGTVLLIYRLAVKVVR